MVTALELAGEEGGECARGGEWPGRHPGRAWRREETGGRLRSCHGGNRGMPGTQQCARARGRRLGSPRWAGPARWAAGELVGLLFPGKLFPFLISFLFSFLTFVLSC